jgi:hypothetical protein
MTVTEVSSESSSELLNGGYGQMEAAVIDELRRAIPAFVGLCARGKPVKEGRYNKGKRVGEKRGLGGDENRRFELETELQCRRR